MMPNIAFRVDSSFRIGAGHLMRCLVLADLLAISGATCVFISRMLNGHLLDLVISHGHRLVVLPETSEALSSLKQQESIYEEWLGVSWSDDAYQVKELIGKESFDWLIVDHYALDIRWEESVAVIAKKIMVIDDLANRRHNCDLLLDVNLGRKHDDYKFLLNKSEAITLVGPRFALLRPEFELYRQRALPARKVISKLETILISMGGVDESNYTGQILESLDSIDRSIINNFTIKVILGSRAPWLSQVRALSAEIKWKTEVLVGVDNMAEIMSKTDLAIGAAGGTSWERCSLGLPSIVLVTAENQMPGAVALQKEGAVFLLESCSQIPALFNKFNDANYFSTKMKNLSKASSKIADGAGANRVIRYLIN